MDWTVFFIVTLTILALTAVIAAWTGAYRANKAQQRADSLSGQSATPQSGGSTRLDWEQHYENAAPLESVNLSKPSPSTDEGTPIDREVKPMSEPRYKTLEKIKSTLTEAGVDESTVADVVSAYQAKNPSAFVDSSTLSDAEFRKKAVEFTRRHLRRFPRTQSALALSLAGLAKGETTKYVR
jgi:hypothetical protein